MARMRSSNPVFTRMRPPAAVPRGPYYGPPSGAGAPPATPTAEELASAFRSPSSLTIDDVIMHTLGLFAIAAVSGAVGWFVAGRSPGLVVVAGLVAVGLNLVMWVTGRINPAMIVIFTVPYGLMLGGVSRFYETLYHGIIPQALLGTAIIFVLMLLGHRSGRLRATPRMRRVVFGTLAGVFVLYLVNLLVGVTTGGQLPVINDATPLGVLFSVAVLVIASLQFTLDFDFIERAIASGAPRSTAWWCAYGLLVSFAWVYLEMLRLLGKLRRM
jgi:uncharacterized YccA/Bax inhibitor family protein